MNRFDVSTHRRFKEGLFWDGESPPRCNWEKVFGWIRPVGAGALALLALYAWAQTSDLEDQLETQKELTRKYIGHLATCMNGGGIYDRAHKTAHFCDRVISVKWEE